MGFFIGLLILLVGSFGLGFSLGNMACRDPIKDSLLVKAVDYLKLLNTSNQELKVLIDKWIEEANNEIGK